MADRLPTSDGLYHFAYSIDLDARGTVHRLEFHFERLDNLSEGTDGAWYLDIYNAAGTPCVLGVKLSLGSDKLAPYRYRITMPRGRLDVVDTSQSGREAGSTDLGTRVVLPYTPP